MTKLNFQAQEFTPEFTLLSSPSRGRLNVQAPEFVSTSPPYDDGMFPPQEPSCSSMQNNWRPTQPQGLHSTPPQSSPHSYAQSYGQFTPSGGNGAQQYSNVGMAPETPLHSNEHSPQQTPSPTDPRFTGGASAMNKAAPQNFRQPSSARQEPARMRMRRSPVNCKDPPVGIGGMEHCSRTEMTKIFIGGLAWTTTSQNLHDHFRPYGVIREAAVIYDKDNRSKGFGFVTFVDAAAASEATSVASPTIDGRRTNCNLAVIGQIGSRFATKQKRGRRRNGKGARDAPSQRSSPESRDGNGYGASDHQRYCRADRRGPYENSAKQVAPSGQTPKFPDYLQRGNLSGVPGGPGTQSPQEIIEHLESERRQDRRERGQRADIPSCEKWKPVERRPSSGFETSYDESAGVRCNGPMMAKPAGIMNSRPRIMNRPINVHGAAAGPRYAEPEQPHSMRQGPNFDHPQTLAPANSTPVPTGSNALPGGAHRPRTSRPTDKHSYAPYNEMPEQGVHRREGERYPVQMSSERYPRQPRRPAHSPSSTRHPSPHGSPLQGVSLQSSRDPSRQSSRNASRQSSRDPTPRGSPNGPPRGAAIRVPSLQSSRDASRQSSRNPTPRGSPNGPRRGSPNGPSSSRRYTRERTRPDAMRSSMSGQWRQMPEPSPPPIGSLTELFDRLETLPRSNSTLNAPLTLNAPPITPKMGSPPLAPSDLDSATCPSTLELDLPRQVLEDMDAVFNGGAGLMDLLSIPTVPTQARAEGEPAKWSPKSSDGGDFPNASQLNRLPAYMSLTNSQTKKRPAPTPAMTPSRRSAINSSPVSAPNTFPRKAATRSRRHLITGSDQKRAQSPDRSCALKPLPACFSLSPVKRKQVPDRWEQQPQKTPITPIIPAGVSPGKASIWSPTLGLMENNKKATPSQRADSPEDSTARMTNLYQFNMKRGAGNNTGGPTAGLSTPQPKRTHVAVPFRSARLPSDKTCGAGRRTTRLPPGLTKPQLKTS